MKEAMVNRIISNEHGVRICACCASCVHCSFGMGTGKADEFRSCNVNKVHEAVLPNDVCKKYEMSPMFQGVHYSNPGGRVKKASYLRMVAAIREMENENNVPKDEAITCEDLRERYTLEKNESIYMNI